VVVELVRIQQLTERIFHFHSSDSTEDGQAYSPETSTMVRLEAFRIELENLRNALPPDLKSNCMFLQTFQIANVGTPLTW
jgi:hypothetical protein